MSKCRFWELGCTKTTNLTLVRYTEPCWCFNDLEQWLCPQHTVKGLQNNEGQTVEGYLHKGDAHGQRDVERAGG